jgi:PEGA domain-containing protein
VAAVDPPLVAKAALLTVKADAGAEVLVDGRPVGEAPISRPIELKDGEHRVVVGKNGYKVYAEDLKLKRGQKKTVEADLDMTAQRVAAWVFFGAAVLSTAGGVVLTVTAITKQRDANTIKLGADAVPRPMTLEEANTYNQAIESRDNLTGLAAASYGLAALSAGVGLLLFTLDEPALSAAASEDTAMLLVNGRF